MRTYSNGDCALKDTAPHKASHQHRYEGQFSNGQPNGKGVYIGADGGHYEGQFADGDPEFENRYI